MVMTPPVIAVMLLLTIGVWLAAGVVIADVRARERRMRELGVGSPRRGRLTALTGRIDRGLLATGFGDRLDARLRGAAVSLRLVDAVGLVLAVAVLLAVVLYPLVGRIGAVVVVLGVVAGANRYLENRRQKRLEAFVAQLPEVARVLSNAASAGLALRSAVAMAAREVDEPARSELADVAGNLAIGRTLDQALSDMNRRLPSRELGVLVQTLVIQARSGGALVSALHNIAATLETRKELRREVQTVTSGAVFSGYVVLAIGVGSVFVMNLLSPGALDQLASTGIGRLVMLAAGSFFALGLFLIRRLTDIDV